MKSKTVSYTTIAFISGFSVLALEISGTRIIAGNLGNSIYTWSALIAIILVSMSFGSMLGGILIDKTPHVKWLLRTLIFASVTTSIAPILASIVQSTAGSMQLIQGALTECALIFALPAFAYGAIPPMCIKLLSSAGSDKRVGFNSGITSMAGSLGSFAGALVTPFLLIPDLSLGSICLCLAASVLLSSLLLIKIAPLSNKATSCFLVLGFGLLFIGWATRVSLPQSPFIFDQNTPYHRIRVQDQHAGNSRVRFLYLDTTLEGGISAGTKFLPLEYQNTWSLVKGFGIPVKKALCIGAGAFGVPERLSEAYPGAKIDVAEIDPMVIEVGFKYFGLEKYPNIQPIAADGRRFLTNNSGNYDLIFIDAYHGIRYIPPHLTTVEFFNLCRQHLTPHGIIMMNVISSVRGDNSELFEAFGATVRNAFPFCGLIPLDPSNLHAIQNIVLVGSSTPWPQNHSDSMMNVASLVAKEVRAMTDQKNPIEAILARQLGESP